MKIDGSGISVSMHTTQLYGADPEQPVQHNTPYFRTEPAKDLFHEALQGEYDDANSSLCRYRQGLARCHHGEQPETERQGSGPCLQQFTTAASTYLRWKWRNANFDRSTKMHKIA